MAKNQKRKIRKSILAVERNPEEDYDWKRKEEIFHNGVVKKQYQIPVAKQNKKKKCSSVYRYKHR